MKEAPFWHLRQGRIAALHAGAMLHELPRQRKLRLKAKLPLPGLAPNGENEFRPCNSACGIVKQIRRRNLDHWSP